jgi:hypothetical protein
MFGAFDVAEPLRQGRPDGRRVSMTGEIDPSIVIARVPGALWVVATIVLVLMAVYAVYYLIFRVGKGPQD